MWTFSTVVRIENSFGTWYALVTLTRGDEAESFFLKFGKDQEPTQEQAQLAGEELALKKNLEQAIATDTPLTRYEFRSKFTLTERVAIDGYDNSNLSVEHKAIVKTILKDFDATDAVHLKHPAVAEALGALEAFGLIGEGRAAQIVGA